MLLFVLLVLLVLLVASLATYKHIILQPTLCRVLILIFYCFVPFVVIAAHFADCIDDTWAAWHNFSFNIKSK